MMMSSRVLQAAGHLVELGVARGEAGDLAALLVELVDGDKAAGDDLADAGQAALDGGVGDIGQLRLHVAQHRDGVFALVRGANAAIVEDAHQLAQQALVADDLDVALDVEVARDALGEEGEIGRAADGIQFAPPGQFFLHREVVDALALGHQIDDGAEDALVRVEGEVLGLQLLGRVADGDAVQQHRAEDRDLGVNR